MITLCNPNPNPFFNSIFTVSSADPPYHKIMQLQGRIGTMRHTPLLCARSVKAFRADEVLSGI